MPGKYSHGVVLANYSSRGIISLPNDKQLDYFKPVRLPATVSDQAPRAPSAPPAQGHPQIARPASTKTSKKAKRHSSIVSPGYTSSQNDPEERASLRDLDDGGTEIRSNTRRRSIIDDPGQKAQGGVNARVLQHGILSPGAREPRRALNSISLPPTSYNIESIAGDTHAGPTLKKASFENKSKSARKHPNALAAQKYEPRDDRRDIGTSRKQINTTHSRQSESLKRHSNGPLLSVHEFLDSLAEANPPGQPKSEQRRLAATELQFDSTTVLTPTKAQSNRKFPTLAKHHAPPFLDRGNVSFIDMSDEEEQEDISAMDGSACISVNTFPPAPISYTVGRRPHVLDLTGQDHLGGVMTATDQSVSQQGEESASISQKTVHKQSPGTEPALVPSYNHDEELVRPVQSTPRSTKQKCVGVKDDSAPSSHVHSSPGLDQDTAPTEPDFSGFFVGDGLGNRREGSVLGTYIHGYHDGTTGGNSSSRDSNVELLPSAPSISHETDSNPSGTPTFARSRTVAFGTNVNRIERGPSMGSETARSATSREEIISTVSKKQVQKLKSEEEMRLRIPTPIPSPAASRKSSSLLSSKTAGLPPQNPATEDLNFGVPSIVRSPRKKGRQSNVTAAARSNSYERPNLPRKQAINPTTPPRKGTQVRSSKATSGPKLLHPSNYSEAEEGHGVGDGSWIWPGTHQLPKDVFRSEAASSPRLDLDTEPKSGSGAVTPRPQTAHRITHVQSHSPRSPATPKALMTAFDDISSSSSVKHRDHEEGMSDEDDFDYLRRQDDEGGDPEAAPSPPDISRYPAVRNSPRAIRATEGRLSSLTRGTWRKDGSGKTKLANPEPDDRLDTIVWTLNTRSRSLSQLGSPGVDGNDAGARADVRTGGSDFRPVVGASGPTEVDGLEAMMLKADEEARTKKSIRAVWGRLRRRIEN